MNQTKYNVIDNLVQMLAQAVQKNERLHDSIDGLRRERNAAILERDSAHRELAVARTETAVMEQSLEALQATAPIIYSGEYPHGR